MSEAALLTARGLGVRLAGRIVLKDVSLALSAGHLVALVGPNGAGKTTLLRAMAGLIPSEGEIEIGGHTLASLPLRERAKRFGYLPQGHVVHWPLPARDIVALGRYPHGATDPARLSPKDAEAVLRAMQAVDVMEFSDRRVTELSGGERSRVALARALAVEAPVILADEPTASLDPRHQIDVPPARRRYRELPNRDTSDRQRSPTRPPGAKSPPSRRAPGSRPSRARRDDSGRRRLKPGSLLCSERVPGLLAAAP